MIRVNIISGFLGAGKTTFIKRLIQEAFQGEQLVLIENEFGEIGIDGEFLKDAGIEITEMNSGCICCTLVGDFGKALRQVIDTYSPDRILIEPSGVGKLSDIIKAVENLQEDEMVLEGAVTVVDGKKAELYLANFGEFYEDQVRHATTVVMSRTQLMEEEAIKRCVSVLRRINEKAPFVTTQWSELGKDALLGALEGNREPEEFLKEKKRHAHGGCCGHGHHGHKCHHHGDHEHHSHHDHEHRHHHADAVFTSWGKETVHRYTEAELAFLLQALSEAEGYGTILRAKGILQMEDGGWKQFDLIPGEYEVREGRADYTGRFCVIGTGLAEEELERLFCV